MLNGAKLHAIKLKVKIYPFPIVRFIPPWHGHPAPGEPADLLLSLLRRVPQNKGQVVDERQVQQVFLVAICLHLAYAAHNRSLPARGSPHVRPRLGARPVRVHQVHPERAPVPGGQVLHESDAAEEGDPAALAEQALGRMRVYRGQVEEADVPVEVLLVDASGELQRAEGTHRRCSRLLLLLLLLRLLQGT